MADPDFGPSQHWLYRLLTLGQPSAVPAPRGAAGGAADPARLPEVLPQAQRKPRRGLDISCPVLVLSPSAVNITVPGARYRAGRRPGSARTSRRSGWPARRPGWPGRTGPPVAAGTTSSAGGSAPTCPPTSATSCSYAEPSLALAQPRAPATIAAAGAPRQGRKVSRLGAAGPAGVAVVRAGVGRAGRGPRRGRRCLARRGRRALRRCGLRSRRSAGGRQRDASAARAHARRHHCREGKPPDPPGSSWVSRSHCRLSFLGEPGRAARKPWMACALVT